jgi:O-methyltransferase
MMHLTTGQLDQILRLVSPYTGSSPHSVWFTAERAVKAIVDGIPGDFMECGVQFGGCAFSMLVAQRMFFGGVQRPVHLVDSFVGLPKATERDGQYAIEAQNLYYADPEKKAFSANCSASRASVEAGLQALGFVQGEFFLHEGWFADTVPALAEGLKDKRLALLRLDGDWYDSTMVCLEHLMPIVSDRAAVLVDDYYAWEGCTLAVHDYFSKVGIEYRIRSMINNEDAVGLSCEGAYFLKARRLHQTG